MKTRLLTTISNIFIFGVGVWICNVTNNETSFWKWNLVAVILAGIAFCNNIIYDVLIFLYQKEDEGECQCGFDWSLGNIRNPCDWIVNFGRVALFCWGTYIYKLGYTSTDNRQWLYFIVVFWLHVGVSLYYVWCSGRILVNAFLKDQ